MRISQKPLFEFVMPLRHRRHALQGKLLLAEAVLPCIRQLDHREKANRNLFFEDASLLIKGFRLFEAKKGGVSSKPIFELV